MSATPELAPGLVIGGRYLLQRRLGAGGFGSVWLAGDAQARGVERPVAVKILHPSLSAPRGRDFQRFRREAEVLSKLDHPNIARAIAYDLEGELAFIVMEHVDGLPLDRIIAGASRSGRTLEPADAARIFDELASAVGYAHGLGVVHRDLKPANVMAVRRGDRVFVKVLDFGIARVAGEAEDAGTTVGRLIGSYHYMAPEQIRGERADLRADVFALGAMVFELATGRRAWARDTEGQPLPAHLPTSKSGPNALDDIMERILRGPRPKPSDVREGLPLELDAVVAKALAIDKADRFDSAVALAERARPLLAEPPEGTGLTVVQLEGEVRRALVDAPADPEPVVMVPPSAGGFGPLPRDPSSVAQPAMMATGVGTVDAAALTAPRSVVRWALPVAAIAAGGALWWALGGETEPAELPVMGASPAAIGAVPSRAITAVPTSTGVGLAPAEAVAPAAPAPRPAPVASSPASRAPSAAASPRPVVEAAAPPPPDTDPLRPLVAAARRPGASLDALTALADAIRAEIDRRPPSPAHKRLKSRVEQSLVDADAEGLVAVAEQLGAR